jgi:hypothetical protein
MPDTLTVPDAPETSAPVAAAPETAPLPSFTVEDLPEVADWARNQDPATGQAVLSHAVNSAYDDLAKSPGFNADVYDQFNQIAQQAQQRAGVPHLTGRTDQWQEITHPESGETLGNYTVQPRGDQSVDVRVNVHDPDTGAVVDKSLLNVPAPTLHDLADEQDKEEQAIRSLKQKEANLQQISNQLSDPVRKQDFQQYIDQVRAEMLPHQQRLQQLHDFTAGRQMLMRERVENAFMNSPAAKKAGKYRPIEDIRRGLATAMLHAARPFSAFTPGIRSEIDQTLSGLSGVYPGTTRPTTAGHLARGAGEFVSNAPYFIPGYGPALLAFSTFGGSVAQAENAAKELEAKADEIAKTDPETASAARRVAQQMRRESLTYGGLSAATLASAGHLIPKIGPLNPKTNNFLGGALRAGLEWTTITAAQGQVLDPAFTGQRQNPAEILKQAGLGALFGGLTHPLTSKGRAAVTPGPEASSPEPTPFASATAAPPAPNGKISAAGMKSRARKHLDSLNQQLNEEEQRTSPTITILDRKGNRVKVDNPNFGIKDKQKVKKLTSERDQLQALLDADDAHGIAQMYGFEIGPSGSAAVVPAPEPESSNQTPAPPVTSQKQQALAAAAAATKPHHVLTILGNALRLGAIHPDDLPPSVQSQLLNEGINLSDPEATATALHRMASELLADENRRDPFLQKHAFSLWAIHENARRRANRLPELTEAELQAAWKQWQQISNASATAAEPSPDVMNPVPHAATAPDAAVTTPPSVEGSSPSAGTSLKDEGGRKKDEGQPPVHDNPALVHDNPALVHDNPSPMADDQAAGTTTGPSPTAASPEAYTGETPPGGQEESPQGQTSGQSSTPGERTHAGISDQAEELGVNQPQKLPSETQAQHTAEAARILRGNPNAAAELVDDLLANGPRALTPVELELLAPYRKALRGAWDEARARLQAAKPGTPEQKQARQDFNQVNDRMEKFLQMRFEANSQAGKNLQALQRADRTDIFDDLPTVIFTTEQKRGKPLNEAERTKLEAAHEAYQKAKDEEEATAQKAETPAPEDIRRIAQDLQQSAPARRLTAQEARDAVLRELAQKLGKSGPEPMPKQISKPKAQTSKPKREAMPSEQRSAQEQAQDAYLKRRQKAVDAAMEAERAAIAKEDEALRDAKLNTPVEHADIATHPDDLEHPDDAAKNAETRRIENDARIEQAGKLAGAEFDALHENDPGHPQFGGAAFMDATGLMTVANMIRQTARDVKTFAHFSARMLRRFGAWIKPHLAALWQAAKDTAHDAVMKLLQKIGAVKFLDAEEGSGQNRRMAPDDGTAHSTEPSPGGLTEAEAAKLDRHLSKGVKDAEGYLSDVSEEMPRKDMALASMDSVGSILNDNLPLPAGWEYKPRESWSPSGKAVGMGGEISPSWYAVIENYDLADEDGDPLRLKISIRDHEQFSQNHDLPDFVGYVHKEGEFWKPESVARAVRQVSAKIKRFTEQEKSQSTPLTGQAGESRQDMLGSGPSKTGNEISPQSPSAVNDNVSGAGFKTDLPPSTARGHVNLSVIHDAIEGIKRTSRNFGEFTARLVQRFGAWIKRHALDLWARTGDALMQHLQKIGAVKFAVEPEGRSAAASTAKASPEEALWHYANEARQNGKAELGRWQSRMEANGFHNTDPATFAAAARAYTEMFRNTMRASRRTATPEQVKQDWRGEAPATLHPIARDLAKAHAAADATLTGADRAHAEELIRRVQADLKDMGHDVTASETARAITGYGEQKPPTLTPAQQRLRELKAQILVKEKQADAMDNKVPWIRRLFSKPSDIVRQETAKLRDLVRNIETEEVKAGRMKTAQQRRVAQLENQIKDIQDQIATPGHPGRSVKTPLPDTPRIRELKARRDALQEHLDDLRADQVKAEQHQKRVAQLQKHLAVLKQRLETGDRPSRPVSGEEPVDIAALKGMIKSVEAELREQDKTMVRQPTVAEAYDLRQRKAAQALEANYKEKLARRQFTKTLPKTHPLSVETEAAIAAAQRAREAFREAAEASGEPAEERLKNAVASIAKRVNDLRNYLAGGTKAQSSQAQRFVDKSRPEYLAARAELTRLQKILKDSRLNGARAARSAMEALMKSMDEQIATLQRTLAEAKRQGRRAPAQEAELAHLQDQRSILDAPTLDRLKANEDAKQARYAAQEAQARATGQAPAKTSRRRPIDAELEAKRVKTDRAKKKLQRTLDQIELAAQPWYQRMLRLPARAKRALVLLSLPIYPKLALAGTVIRPLMTFARETVGRAGLKLMMPDIAAAAEGEGGHSGLFQASKDYARGWARGWAQAKNVEFTGMTDNQLLYSDKGLSAKSHTEWEAYLLAHPHMVLKAPAWEAAFSLSEGNRLAAKGYTSPAEVPEAELDQLRRAAAEDADHAILVNDNFWNQAYSSLMSGLEKLGLPGKLAAETLKFENPIVRIPTNLVNEAGSYIFGSITAPLKRAILKARQNGEITPKQANDIARTFKNGITFASLVGLYLIAPGAVRFGGQYIPGEKRKPNDLQPGDVEVFGVKLPHLATHAGIFTAAQSVATGVRSYLHNNGLPASAWESLMGLTEDIPVIRGTGDFLSNLKPGKEAAAARSRDLRSLIPAPLRLLAEQQDYHGTHGYLYRMFIDTDRAHVTNRGSSFQTALPRVPLPLLNQLPSRLDLPVKKHQ